MKITTTRDELKKQAELLALLEKYEDALALTQPCSNATLEMHAGSIKKLNVFLDPYCRDAKGGSKTLKDKLDSIVAHHVTHAMTKCIELIKSEMTIEIE